VLKINSCLKMVNYGENSIDLFINYR